MENVLYKGYTIKRKFLSSQVNYIVSDKDGYLFTLVPKDDGFLLSGRNKVIDDFPSSDLVKEISDYIVGYTE